LGICPPRETANNIGYLVRLRIRSETIASGAPHPDPLPASGAREIGLRNRRPPNGGEGAE
jgi:hypothetical protein